MSTRTLMYTHERTHIRLYHTDFISIHNCYGTPCKLGHTIIKIPKVIVI